jgi:hypothetical protein
MHNYETLQEVNVNGDITYCLVKIEIPPLTSVPSSAAHNGRLAAKQSTSQSHLDHQPRCSRHTLDGRPIHGWQVPRSTTMDGPSRMPGFYPATPASARYNPPPSSSGINGAAHPSPANNVLGSIGRAGGPIRRTPAAAVSRARAHSTPYARPTVQNTPGSGSRQRRDDDDDDDDEVLDPLPCGGLMAGFD